MFIFLNFNILVLLLHIFYSFIVTWFFSMFSFSIKLIDINSRILLDFFFINNFFFLWTNLWYITFYFIMFNILIFFFKNHCLRNQMCNIAILFSLMWSIIFYDFCNYNFLVIDGLNFPLKENNLLNNSVNKIHPVMLHLSLNLFFFYFFLNTKCLIHADSLNLFTMGKFFKMYLVLIMFTLYLGSWWALQEGSWGGWWNWDVSEVFGLLILFRILLLFHSAIYLTFIKIYEFYIFNSLICFIYFYSLMQINFTLVSHNFGFRNLKSFNPELSFLMLSLVSILIWYNTLFKLKEYTITFHVKQKTLKQNIAISLILISIPFYISIFTLLQDFLWNVFEFKVVNIKFNYRNYLVIIVIFLISSFIKLDYKLLFSGNFLYNNYIYLLILLSKSYETRIRYYLLHTLIVYGVYLSVIYAFTIIETWTYLTSQYNINSFFTYSLNSAKIESTYNFFKYNTSVDIKTFILLIKDSISNQDYYPTGTMLGYCIKVYDNLSLVLDFLLMLIFTLLILMFFSKKYF